MKKCLNSQEISERQHQPKHVNIHNGVLPVFLERRQRELAGLETGVFLCRIHFPVGQKGVLHHKAVANNPIF